MFLLPTVLPGALSGVQAVSKQTATTTGLTITLDQLTPVVPTAKSVLALSGNVSNATDATVSSLSVSMRVSLSRVVDRNQLGPLEAGDVDPGTRGVIDGTTNLTDPLPAGSSEAWSLELPMSNLQLADSGVYYVRLEAVADQDSSVNGSTNTFIPLFPNPAVIQPTKVVWLWPMSA